MSTRTYAKRRRPRAALILSRVAVVAFAFARLGCALGRDAEDDARRRGDDAGAGDAAPDARQACGDGDTCAPCEGTPWGTVAHGFSGTAYQAAMPAGPCESQTRTCADGTMTGTFVASTCSAGCSGTPWGDVIAGFSGTAFLNPVAPYGTTCQSTSQTRTCADGALTGTYPNAACANYPCAWSGALFPHADAAFEAPTFPSVWHECGLDGSWGPALSGNPVALGTPCEWNGRWFEQTTCGYNNGITYRCQPSGWIEAPACPTGP